MGRIGDERREPDSRGRREEREEKNFFALDSHCAVSTKMFSAGQAWAIAGDESVTILRQIWYTVPSLRSGSALRLVLDLDLVLVASASHPRY